jgi:hypothetical protein
VAAVKPLDLGARGVQPHYGEQAEADRLLRQRSNRAEHGIGLGCARRNLGDRGDIGEGQGNARYRWTPRRGMANIKLH